MANRSSVALAVPVVKLLANHLSRRGNGSPNYPAAIKDPSAGIPSFDEDAAKDIQRQLGSEGARIAGRMPRPFPFNDQRRRQFKNAEVCGQQQTPTSHQTLAEFLGMPEGLLVRQARRLGFERGDHLLPEKDQ